MKALWFVLLLAGCAGSEEYFKAIGDGFKGAGAASSDTVYRTQNGLPERAAKNVDQACMADCTKKYSWAYCEKECSY